MPELPPIPPWNAAHVIHVHFPIGLLMLAAPAVLFFAMLIPKASRVLLAAAALLFVIGTAGLWVAASSGEAAYELAEKQGAEDDPAIHEALEKHEHMGEEARNYYTLFAAVLLLYTLIFSAARARIAPAANVVVLLLFLGGAGWLALHLANTGHLGGQLVHEHGILAPLTGSEAAVAATEAAGDGGSEDDSSGSGSDGESSDDADNSGPGSASSGRDSG